jgi:type II secretory pathway component PulK
MKRYSSGFILPTVLWVIAFMALAVSYFSIWIQGELEEAQGLDKRIQVEVEAFNTKSAVLFWFATQRLSMRGLEINPDENKAKEVTSFFDDKNEVTFVALNDKPYATDKLFIKIQDEKGLLNANAMLKPDWLALLDSYEVAEDKIDSLYTALKDYISPNFKEGHSTASGASYDDYEREGRPEPALGPLRTPWELKRVMGWDEQDELWRRQSIADYLTTNGDKRVNINTAPSKILNTIEGMTEEIENTIFEKRDSEEGGYKTRNDVIKDTGLNLRSLRKFYTFPGTSQRVTLFAKGIPFKLQFSVTLTPKGDKIPWQINYQIPRPFIKEEVEASDGEKEVTPILDFPDPETIFGKVDGN